MNEKRQVKVVRKVNKKSVATLVIVITIIIAIFVYASLYKSLDNTNTNNNTNNNGSSGNTQKDDTPKELTEEEKKLKELNNINEKLSFFKNENIDRYIAYKNKNPDLDLEKVIVYVNIGLDNEFYTNVKDSPYKQTNTIIVNKFYSVGSDYVPEDLETINSMYSSKTSKMTKDAKNAFEELAKNAKKEGYIVRAVSTYRDYAYQTRLYNNYAKSDGTEKADRYSARAGYSEHQTGLAVDVDNANLSYTSFGSTKEFEWMKNNSYKYGFILRYTKENEFITGYKDEPWHYRYVGVEIAKYIQEHPMTYEEYFVRFLDNKKIDQ